jgi:hypothetical protein
VPERKLENFFKFKKGANFNRRNTLSILRIALKVSADASLRVTACQNLSLTQKLGKLAVFVQALVKRGD